MSTRAPRRAAVYTRVSLDLAGEGLGVERQREVCQQWAERYGWTIAEVYEEEPTSAFKEKDRPQYARMLRDLEEGTRDGVIAYAPDRLTRQTKGLIELVELAQAQGFPIGTVQGGDVDLNTAAGRNMARVAASFAQQESELKGERQRLANAQRLKSGQAFGRRRGFGWADKTCLELDPIEGPAIQKACADILAGKSTTEIAREWNEAGLMPAGTKPKKENPWSAKTVHRLIIRPSNAGIVTYQGQEIPDVEAKWTPIISKELREQVLAKLSAGFTVKSPGPRKTHRYLLSGLLTCGSCGGPMSGRTTHKGAAQYVCMNGAGGCYLSIQAWAVEPIVTDYVVGTLNSMKPADLLDEESSILQGKVSRELLQIAQDRLEVASMKVSIKSKAALLSDLDSREEELQRTLGKLTQHNVLSSVVAQVLPWMNSRVSMEDVATSHAQVRDAFDGLSVKQRGEIIGALGKYYVKPGRGHRVEIFPRDIRTGKVSQYTINEDPYSLEE